MTAPDEDRDWWDLIGEMRWQHVVLAIAALAAVVALSFAPMCSLRISTGPSTTTTTVAP